MHLNSSIKKFWQEFAHPILALAPMEDVTDTCFREIVLQNSAAGNLNVVFTEFLSTDGMCHPKGRGKVEHRLMVSASERLLLKSKGVKIVAQIWGNKPENFKRTIDIILNDYEFDGVDINMGCPVKNIVAHGSCSALIDNPSQASEIIHAAREASNLPLSVKTRLGVKQIETERWISFLLSHPLDAIILHGRIQKQMSEGEANWHEIARAVEIRNSLAPHIKIIGNGDLGSVDQAKRYCKEFGVDGGMIGRGIFRNPWLFGNEKQPSTHTKLAALKSHIALFESVWGKQKNYAILQRFFKIYLSGFDGASDLRQQLIATKTSQSALAVIDSFAANNTALVH